LKERIDKVLVTLGLASTRAQAKSLIEMNRVKVNGQVVSKAGQLVLESDDFEVNSPDYVGRGAFKLESALSDFKIDVNDLRVIDVGASTGGFTEVLLRSGAAHVLAVDVGTNQLAAKLRLNPKVKSLEGTHILDVKVSEAFDGAVIDLSFISLTKVLSHIKTLLIPNAFIVALIKPQFEAGREDLPKDGVIKDKEVREKILNNVLSHCSEIGLFVEQTIESPIHGKAGNTEYLSLLRVQN